VNEHLDHTALDWDLVARGVYSLHQRFHYEYDAPIRDLRHRLVVVPPARHGDQRTHERAVRIEGADATVTERVDGFGNVVIDVHAPVVEAVIDFDVRVVVERSAVVEPASVPALATVDPRLHRSTPLTRPDLRIAAWARELRAAGAPGESPLGTAERINEAVHQALTYDLGATDVGTPAAQALAIGRGVCQDHAHVALAVCL
jgi:transglutaminase-like putative cysteine protease